MDKRKRAKLGAAGWTVGTPREFLSRSDEEAAFVEFKLALSKTLQALRVAQELSQVDVAGRLQSSQSRVAKMEASDPGVSVDLLVRSLFKLGANAGGHCEGAASAPRGRSYVTSHRISASRRLPAPLGFGRSRRATPPAPS